MNQMSSGPGARVVGSATIFCGCGRVKALTELEREWACACGMAYFLTRPVEIVCRPPERTDNVTVFPRYPLAPALALEAERIPHVSLVELRWLDDVPGGVTARPKGKGGEG